MVGSYLDFDGDGRAEVPIRSAWGIGLLEFTGGALGSPALKPNGARFGGWLLNTTDNVFVEAVDVDGDGRAEMLVTSPWGIGVIKQAGSGFNGIALAGNGTRIGGWLLNTADNRIGPIGDFDGDGAGEPRAAREPVDAQHLRAVMAVMREDVHAALSPDEIDYNAVAEHLGPPAVPILREFIAEGDPAIASKATYLVARIPSDETPDAIQDAAIAAEPLVRLAAASVAPAIGVADAPELLGRLLDDDDVGARKQALDSAARFRDHDEVKVRLERIALGDDEKALRSIAGQLLQAP